MFTVIGLEFILFLAFFSLQKYMLAFLVQSLSYLNQFLIEAYPLVEIPAISNNATIGSI